MRYWPLPFIGRIWKFRLFVYAKGFFLSNLVLFFFLSRCLYHFTMSKCLFSTLSLVFSFDKWSDTVEPPFFHCFEAIHFTSVFLFVGNDGLAVHVFSNNSSAFLPSFFRLFLFRPVSFCNSVFFPPVCVLFVELAVLMTFPLNQKEEITNDWWNRYRIPISSMHKPRIEEADPCVRIDHPNHFNRIFLFFGHIQMNRMI